jgi:hypothetical protein
VVPDTLDDPLLLRALGLETKGDGTDTTTLVYLRLCDKLGLGRSPPHVSTGKFKFLFPGVAIDKSQLKKKVSGKRAREEAVVAPEEAPSRSVWHTLDALLEESYRVAQSVDGGGAKSILYRVAKRFLRSCFNMMDRNDFDEAFTDYTRLPVSLVLETMGNKQIIEGFINSNFSDAKVRHSMMRRIDRVATVSS